MRQTRLIPFFTCCLLIAALPIHAGKTLTVTAGNLQNLYQRHRYKTTAHMGRKHQDSQPQGMPHRSRRGALLREI